MKLCDEYKLSEFKTYIREQKYNKYCFTEEDLGLILEAIEKFPEFGEYFRVRTLYHDIRGLNQIFTTRLLGRAKMLKYLDYKVDFDIPEYQDQM